MPDVVFRWVGDGEDYFKQALLEAEVEVTGWVTRDEVLDYLQASTIYLSSAHWEGMPVSLIEANYARLPVVAAACPGNIDAVSHGKTGWLFYSESEAVRQVLGALADPREQRKLSGTLTVRRSVDLIQIGMSTK